MAIKGGVTGLDVILKNFNRSKQFVSDRSLKGLTNAALTIKREAMQEAPVDQGNLRSSAFVTLPQVGETQRTDDFKGDDAARDAAAHTGAVSRATAIVTNLSTKSVQAVAVGFSAIYALRTHENPRAGKTEGLSPKGAKYKSFSEVGKWKFLEDPLKRNTKNIVSDLGKALKFPEGRL
jgi:hypothetical protein